MSRLEYAVWAEDGLYHWAVHVRRGPECGHGAATDLLRARAEAIDFGLDPARADDIARFEQSVLNELLRSAQRAVADVHQRATIANSRVAHWVTRCAVSLALVENSRKAIAQTRQLLQDSPSPREDSVATSGEGQEFVRATDADRKALQQNAGVGEPECLPRSKE